METNQGKLSTDDTTYWRPLLEKRKRLLTETEETLKRHAFTDLSTNETGELSKIRLHPADLATDTQTVEVLESLSSRNIRSLRDIEDAMIRLDQGQFGKCLSCGEKIPRARLEAIPETRFCIECEEEFEEVKTRFARSEKAENITELTELTKAFNALWQLTALDIMQEHPISVNMKDDLNTAITLMSDHNIRHLPVVNLKGEIQGIISDRDVLNTVLQIKPWKVVEKMRNPYNEINVTSVMTKTPETVEPETSLQDVSTLLLENKISCVPVVDGNFLIGIITESDFVKLVGQGF